jgi:hypothetical protein
MTRMRHDQLLFNEMNFLIAHYFGSSTINELKIISIDVRIVSPNHSTLTPNQSTASWIYFGV